MSIAQFHGHPRRSYYTGSNLERALTIEDLRARTHKRMPRFVLEYLEGGAEDEATLALAREALDEWRFVPRTLVDVGGRTPAYDILGVKAQMPVIVAPTGLNGIFCRGADVALATGAAAAGVPFVQSTMSTTRSSMWRRSKAFATGSSSTCSARTVSGTASSIALRRPVARRWC